MTTTIDKRTRDTACEALRREMDDHGHPNLWKIQNDGEMDRYCRNPAIPGPLDPYTIRCWEAFVVLDNLVL